MALRHPQYAASSRVHSCTNLGRARISDWLWSVGLKESVLFDDAADRVFRSTHRATSFLDASIARALYGQANSTKEAEKLFLSKKSSDEPEGSVSAPEDEAYGVRLRVTSCRGTCYWNAQTSNGSMGSQPATGELGRIYSSEMLITFQPELPLLHPSESFPNAHTAALSSSGAIDVPPTAGLQNSCEETGTFGQVTESCVECRGAPEAPSTPDLEPELKIRDTKGHNSADVTGGQPYTVSNRIDDEDNGDNLMLAGEDDTMLACRSTHLNSPQSEIVCMDYNSPSDLLCTAFDSKAGANSNTSLETLNFEARKSNRIASNPLDLLTVGIFETTSMQNLPFQDSPHSHSRPRMPNFVRLLKKVGSDGDARLLFEQNFISMQICLKLAEGQRASIGASFFSRRWIFKRYPPSEMPKRHASFEHSRIRTDGHYRNLNRKILVQLQQSGHSRARGSVPPKCLFVKQTAAMAEQGGECHNWPSSSIDTCSGSGSSHLLEDRDEGFLSCMESSSQMLDDSQSAAKDFQCSVEDKNTFESDEWNQHVLLDVADLEVRNGDSAYLREVSSEKTDEFQEGVIESSFQSKNKVDDCSNLPIDQVEKYPDTCLGGSQRDASYASHGLTPEVRFLELPVREIPSKVGSSLNESLVEEGLPRSFVYDNGNENSSSCTPVAEPCDCTPSLGFVSLVCTREGLGISMPCTRVREKLNQERLEHFAEGFLLRCHIMRQQRRAQLAPPFPPKDSTGYVPNAESARGKPLEVVKPNLDALCSQANKPENGLEGIFLTKPYDAALCYDRDWLGASDVVIDIVGLINYIESQCNQVKTFTGVSTNSTDLSFVGRQTVFSNFSVVIVTIITIVVYTKTLLEGGLSWVGARAEKEESR